MTASDLQTNYLPAVFVTGRVLGRESSESHGVDCHKAVGVLHCDGIVWTTAWDASDSRLSGDVTTTCNTHIYGGGWSATSIAVEVKREGWLVVNQDGSWSGSGTGLNGGLPDFGQSTVILTGAGDYEGLKAYVVVDSGQEEGTVKGLIFPGPMPQTVAATGASTESKAP